MIPLTMLIIDPAWRLGVLVLIMAVMLYLAWRFLRAWRIPVSWPRGEVGAGVVVISLGYGVGGPAVTVAVLSLALNLLLTGFFIWIVKRLIRGVPPRTGS
jgi:flagellar biogenesis protein FliO